MENKLKNNELYKEFMWKNLRQSFYPALCQKQNLPAAMRNIAEKNENNNNTVQKERGRQTKAPEGAKNGQRSFGTVNNTKEIR